MFVLVFHAAFQLNVFPLVVASILVMILLLFPKLPDAVDELS